MKHQRTILLTILGGALIAIGIGISANLSQATTEQTANSTAVSAVDSATKSNTTASKTQKQVIAQAKETAEQASTKATGTAATITEELTAKWQATLADQDSRVDIAVYLPTTKQTIHLTNDQSQGTFATASIVKVSILAQVLHELAQKGATLSSTQQNQAVAMIENSSNDAATYFLLNVLGSYSALNRIFADLSMTSSQVNQTAWGITQTTATDQLKLLNAIFYEGTYLTSASQAYLQKLMGQVSEEQDWGVSSGSASWQLKNGWLTDEGNTMINSIGHVTTDSGFDYTIAILTDQNVSEASGEALVSQLAAVTSEVLDQQ
ncbi:serine hydrolase [Lapidilactobacillus salsurivasis]